mmetsp:Transcript_21404/g.27845  ORF Transcript_21404/g.27845 Transcript_21404/m.27845 type:complete len:103 (-) Transcript_21404:172-480(-)
MVFPQSSNNNKLNGGSSSFFSASSIASSHNASYISSTSTVRILCFHSSSISSNGLFLTVWSDGETMNILVKDDQNVALLFVRLWFLCVVVVYHVVQLMTMNF